MILPGPVPVVDMEAGDFAKDVEPDDLVYFLLNVGDGDTQLILLPEVRGLRQAIVVDVATRGKLPALIEDLEAVGLFPEGTRFAVVVGTHPHDDHIGGMPEFIDRFVGLVERLGELGPDDLGGLTVAAGQLAGAAPDGRGIF